MNVIHSINDLPGSSDRDGNTFKIPMSLMNMFINKIDHAKLLLKVTCFFENGYQPLRIAQGLLLITCWVTIQHFVTLALSIDRILVMPPFRLKVWFEQIAT
ncbi:MAG: hypothetical protein DWQ07_26040 [Chloroflexi bacterium]|nr:MAG: hypothetical protein DWQ07_26040 [Chloroflexota bacterium]